MSNEFLQVSELSVNGYGNGDKLNKLEKHSTILTFDGLNPFYHHSQRVDIPEIAQSDIVIFNHTKDIPGVSYTCVFDYIEETNEKFLTVTRFNGNPMVEADEITGNFEFVVLGFSVE